MVQRQMLDVGLIYNAAIVAVQGSVIGNAHTPDHNSHLQNRKPPGCLLHVSHVSWLHRTGNLSNMVLAAVCLVTVVGCSSSPVVSVVSGPED